MVRFSGLGRISVCDPGCMGIDGPIRKEKPVRNGGIGGSLFLVALGAILYWAVSIEGEGFNINTIGLILLIVGIVGVVLTLVMTASADAADDDNDVTIIER